MSFSRTALAEEVAKAMSSPSKSSKLAQSVAAYLIDTGKTSEINSLERDIMQLRADKDNAVELTAISAHPIEDKQLKEIERMVRQLNPDCKEVIINQTQDETVIGGVRLELANQLLDLSAAAKLNKLRQLTS